MNEVIWSFYMQILKYGCSISSLISRYNESGYNDGWKFNNKRPTVYAKEIKQFIGTYINE